MRTDKNPVKINPKPEKIGWSNRFDWRELGGDCTCGKISRFTLGKTRYNLNKPTRVESFRLIRGTTATVILEENGKTPL